MHADRKTAFLGDSLIAGWSYPVVNLGVRGNTSTQMLQRFPRLVPDHGYAEVVILGGTNDILLGLPPEQTVHTLEAIAGQAAQRHVEPVLCEVPPIFHGPPGDSRDYSPAVRELNRRIATLASAHHWALVDFYTPLEHHPGYSSDGIHMKRRGYLVMQNALLHPRQP